MLIFAILVVAIYGLWSVWVVRKAELREEEAAAIIAEVVHTRR
jgi:hypothetical protein